MNMPGKWLHPWIEPLPNTSTTQIHFFAVRVPDGMEPGRLLVAAIMERPLRDLLDLFEQVRFVILEPEKAVVRYGGTKIDLTMSLDIDLETQAFRVWAEDTEQLITLRSSLLSNDSFYKKPARSSCFSNVLAGFFLGWWLGGD